MHRPCKNEHVRGQKRFPLQKGFSRVAKAPFMRYRFISYRIGFISFWPFVYERPISFHIAMVSCLYCYCYQRCSLLFPTILRLCFAKSSIQTESIQIDSDYKRPEEDSNVTIGKNLWFPEVKFEENEAAPLFVAL